jgi:hypothetical protein
MNAKNWRACVKDGVTVSKPVYAAQIAIYQAYMEPSVPGISAAPALFTAINKDTAELHHELVPFDADLAQRMSDRAVRILQATDAGELLPRIAASRDFFECRFCAHRAVLGAGCMTDEPTDPSIPTRTTHARRHNARYAQGKHRPFQSVARLQRRGPADRRVRRRARSRADRAVHAGRLRLLRRADPGPQFHRQGPGHRWPPAQHLARGGSGRAREDGDLRHMGLA